MDAKHTQTRTHSVRIRWRWKSGREVGVEVECGRREWMRKRKGRVGKGSESRNKDEAKKKKEPLDPFPPSVL